MKNWHLAAKNEQLSLIKTNSTLEGYVVRMPKAYPVYDLDYSKNIDEIEKWLSYEHKNIPNR